MQGTKACGVFTESSVSSPEAPRPFVKTVGGKSHMLWRLGEIAPKTILTFYECFVGGGALFFLLARQGRFRRAVLTDKDEDLVRTWLAIQRNVVGVLRELDKHVHTKRHYLKVRAQDSSKLTDEACAARRLFLVKAGFNGLWRTNASGQMNVPFGRQSKMLIFADPGRLKACAAVLNARPVTIIHADFADTTRRVRLGDFVFCDPPYVPVSKTSSFTAYTAGGFTTADQQRLAAWFRELDTRGISALACNSNCELVDKLYAGLPIERIMATRAINSDPGKRGAIKEILCATSALRDYLTIGGG